MPASFIEITEDYRTYTTDEGVSVEYYDYDAQSSEQQGTNKVKENLIFKSFEWGSINRCFVASNRSHCLKVGFLYDI